MDSVAVYRPAIGLLSRGDNELGCDGVGRMYEFKRVKGFTSANKKSKGR